MKDKTITNVIEFLSDLRLLISQACLDTMRENPVLANQLDGAKAAIPNIVSALNKIDERMVEVDHQMGEEIKERNEQNRLAILNAREANRLKEDNDNLRKDKDATRSTLASLSSRIEELEVKYREAVRAYEKVLEELTQTEKTRWQEKSASDAEWQKMHKACVELAELYVGSARKLDELRKEKK